MTTNWRVLYGVTGAVLLLCVVGVDCHIRTGSTRMVSIVQAVAPPEPYSSIAGYLMSVAGFYLLANAVMYGRLHSHRRVTCLIAALVLASLLVAGMAAFWEFRPRHITYEP